jgi:hypothetical protein
MTRNDDAFPLKGNFVLLKAGTLQLLLPQADVGAAQFLPTDPLPASDQAGLFELPPSDTDDALYVAALSPQMSLLHTLPPGRFLMASFVPQTGVAMCWDEVKVLIDTEISPINLPPVMVSTHAPLTQYVELGDEIAFCCTAERLMAHTFPA